MEIYETERYDVEYRKDGISGLMTFDTEEMAVFFAKRLLPQGYIVKVLEVRHAINWWL